MKKLLIFLMVLVNASLIFVFFVFDRQEITEKTSDLGILASGRFTETNKVNRPSLVYIDPANNFSLSNIDFWGFDFNFIGIHEARPILINNEYKIALGGYSHKGDQAKQTEFIILNNGAPGFDNLEIEFKENIEDARIRAIFVENIDSDAEKEIVIGTRPHGILKYYKLIDGVWMGFNIDVLNETIHDILIADINENGRNEIMITVSPSTPDNDLPGRGYTGKIIKYELDPDKNTWQKETIWIYNERFTRLPPDEGKIFEHARYLFVSDVDGDGLKELIANVLGSQNIEIFRWNGLNYSKETIEGELETHNSAITVGDVDYDGKDEILAFTLVNNTLLLYDYDNNAWSREVLIDDLESGGNSINFLYLIDSVDTSYKKILYYSRSLDNSLGSTFYYLKRTDDSTWKKIPIDVPDQYLTMWGMFSAYPR